MQKESEEGGDDSGAGERRVEMPAASLSSSSSRRHNKGPLLGSSSEAPSAAAFAEKSALVTVEHRSYELADSIHGAFERRDFDQVLRFLEMPALDPNCWAGRSKKTLLLLAAEAGRPDIVELLLARGADPDGESYSGVTALSTAVTRGHEEIALALVQAGADVHKSLSYKSTSDLPPLYHCFEMPAVAEALLAAGAAPLPPALLNRRVADAIINGDEAAALRYVAAPGVDVDGPCGVGDDPKSGLLTLASSRGHVEFARRLQAMGASVNGTSADAMAPLMAACAGGHAQTALFLLETGADAHAKTAMGQTALDFARHCARQGERRVGMVAVIRALAQDAALTCSTSGAGGGGGKEDGVASANDGEEEKESQLETIAAGRAGGIGSSSSSSSSSDLLNIIYDAFYANDFEEVFRLLHREPGVNPNRTAKQPRTLLMLAVEAGRLDLVQRLIKLGADPNKPKLSPSASTLAVSHGHEDIALALVAHGADVSPGSIGPPPLFFCEDMPAVAEALLAAGAVPLTPELLSRRVADAIRREDIDAALRNATADGFDVDAECFGNTLLSLASARGQLPVVKQLLERGADINKASAFSKTTPLMAACRVGHLDVALFLLENGADASAASANGATAIRLAEQLSPKYGMSGVIRKMKDALPPAREADAMGSLEGPGGGSGGAGRKRERPVDVGDDDDDVDEGNEGGEGAPPTAKR